MAVEIGVGEAEMAQHRRRDVDERGARPMNAGGKTAARHEQKRALLVRAEPAMLAKAGHVLGPFDVADAFGLLGLKRRQVFRLLAGLKHGDAASLVAKRRSRPSPVWPCPERTEHRHALRQQPRLGMCALTTVR
jgi:hypothetical protein